jgi:hypothetical protein
MFRKGPLVSQESGVPVINPTPREGASARMRLTIVVPGCGITISVKTMVISSRCLRNSSSRVAPPLASSVR